MLRYMLAKDNSYKHSCNSLKFIYFIDNQKKWEKSADYNLIKITVLFGLHVIYSFHNSDLFHWIVFTHN